MDFKLAELRKRRGITQKELAETLLVSPQTISKWENGMTCPDLEMLVRFWSDNRYVIGNCAVGYQL